MKKASLSAKELKKKKSNSDASALGGLQSFQLLATSLSAEGVPDLIFDSVPRAEKAGTGAHRMQEADSV